MPDVRMPYSDIPTGYQLTQANPFADLIPKNPRQLAGLSEGPASYSDVPSGYRVAQGNPPGGQIAKVRQQFPQYGDMSDQALADALYKKFYSDMPREQFNKKIGLPGATGNLADPISQRQSNPFADLIPPSPAGYRIDSAGAPPLPPGYQLDGPQRDAVPTSGSTEIAKGGVPHEAPTFATGNLLPLSRNLNTGELTPAVPGFIRNLLVATKNAMDKPQAYDPTTGEVHASPEAIRGGMQIGLAAATSSLPRGMAPDVIAARAAPPSTEQLGAMAKAAYQDAQNAGLVVNPDSFKRMVAGIAYKAKNEGIDPTIHPKAFAAVRRLAEAADEETPKTLQQIDTLRRVVKAAAASSDPDERRIASIGVDRIDDYLSRLSTKDVSAGDAAAGAQAIATARGLWSRMRKSELIDNLTERATNAVGANYTQAGMETALRQQYRALANNQKLMRGFTKEEQGAIRRVVRGAPIENVLRLIGKAAPRGVVSGGFGLGVGATMGPAAGAGVMAAGEVARRAAAGLAKRNVNRVSELIRSGPQY